MKILLVEDDKIIWENIKTYLEKNWFVVDWFQDGKQAFIRALEYDYDIIILDVMLPSKDGFQIAKQLRKYKIFTPIIFLTAKDDLESKEIGFTSGWDDYLTKPFSLKELLLRIRNLVKRSKNLENLNILKYKDIELNQDTKEVFKNWEKITLTPKEFKLLEELMLNQWKVLSKEDLLISIWWYNNDIYSDVIRTHIKSLRDKIWHEYIKTVRWMWFIME